MNEINVWNIKIKGLEYLLVEKYGYDDVEFAKTKSDYILKNNSCETRQDRLDFCSDYYEHLFSLKEEFEKYE